mmetsp:Transcript_398/g.592  ORF Transcript_398/g.592 Transcript_398/m.592 type:complete len:545 (+) Transcript_398:55-1689(+)
MDINGLRQTASESSDTPTPSNDKSHREDVPKSSVQPTPLNDNDHRESAAETASTPKPVRCWDLENPSAVPSGIVFDQLLGDHAKAASVQKDKKDAQLERTRVADADERTCYEMICDSMTEFFDDCFGFELVDLDVNDFIHADVIKKVGASIPRVMLDPISILRSSDDDKEETGNGDGSRWKPQVCSGCGHAFLCSTSKFCRICGEARDMAELERIMKKKEAWDAENERRKQHQPYFTILWPLLVLVVWAVGAFIESGKEENKDIEWHSIQAGLDTAFPGDTLLQVHSQCEDYRISFWLYRLYLYQFTHIGLLHVLSNCLIVWILGIRLERLHGTLRMALFFNIGVIGGACCFYVSDAHSVVAGMSGGVYAVQGMHWGYLALNWSEKRHPFLWLLMLGGWVVFDLINYWVLVDDEGHSASTSNSAHLGGAVTGCLIAVMWGENLVERSWEKYRWWIAGSLLFGAFCFCFSWNIPWPPKTVFDFTPWCWKKLIYNTTYFGDTQWHCVRCGNDDGSTCISTWEKQTWQADVSLSECHSKYGGWASSE